MIRIIPPQLLLLALLASPAVAQSPTTSPTPSRFLFTADGKQFTFDTSAFRGILHRDGKALGLTSVVDLASNTTISGAYGLLSHYRLLDAGARYGTGCWDWPSSAELLPDGRVKVTWSADDAHPLDMTAIYSWRDKNTLDLATTVTPKKNLQNFEVFLASYFAGFPVCAVYANPDNNPSFVPAEKAAGDWQAFPRDDNAARIINDGRWQRPPNPVDWKIPNRLAAPLAIRRDAKTGLTAVVMAPPNDCFAVLAPYGEEGHRSIYFSLFGRDLSARRPATASTRLVIAPNLTDDQAISLYQRWMKERIKAGPDSEG